MERDLLPNTWKIDLGSYGFIQGNFDNKSDDTASTARNFTSGTAPQNSTPAEEESDTDDEDKLTPSFFWTNQNLFVRLFREMEALEGRLAREVADTIRIEQMLKNCRAEGQENIRNVKNMLFDLSLDILESTSKRHMLREAKEQIFYVYKRAVKQEKYENIMDDDDENIVIKSLRTVMKALGCSDTEDSDEDKSQDEEVSENEGAAEDQESADEDKEDIEESKVQMHDKGKSEYKKESDDKRMSEYKKESDDKGKSEYKNEPDDRVESKDKKQSDVRDDSHNRSESVIVECSDIVESGVLVECSDTLTSSDIVESSVVVECSDIGESEEKCKYYLLCDDEESDYKEESEYDKGLDSEKDFGDDEASADDESICF